MTAALYESVFPIDAASDLSPVARVVPSPRNPMGVARAIVAALYARDGDELLLRSRSGDFHHWDGRCWPEAESRAIRGAVYTFLENATFNTKDGPESWAPTRHKVDDVLDALRAVVHLGADVEAPAWLDDCDLPATEMVAVANGLLHLPSRRLYSHRSAFWTHHALPFDYDPQAPAPHRWLAFLRELWGDDEESIATLQEEMGYLVGGDTRQQKIFLLVGPKRSGKGTIGRVLTGLLGHHNVAAPTLAGLATNFGLAPLIGRPLALVSDARLSNKADNSIVVERLLSVSGEDSITIDRKYRDPWTGRLPARFLVLTNELPRPTNRSGALSSRFVLLILNQTFYGREDPTLTDQLLTEATGILSWSLGGLDRLTQRGYFTQPATGADAMRQLEDLASPVAAFIREHCRVAADASATVDELWSAWRSWCETDNRHPGTKAVFGRDLRSAVPTLKRVRHRAIGRQASYEGIGIRSDHYIAADLGTLGTAADSDPTVHGVPRDSAMYMSHSSAIADPDESEEELLVQLHLEAGS